MYKSQHPDFKNIFKYFYRKIINFLYYNNNYDSTGNYLKRKKIF